jgi:hypothetical protein
MLPRAIKLELMIKCTHEPKKEKKKKTITTLIVISPWAKCILIQ